MKSFHFLLIILIFCGSVDLIAQQLEIDDNFSEQQLVEDYLVQGCVEISNIESQVNGRVDNINSFGYFQKKDSNFPFENGVVLSTGRATSGANGQTNAVLNDGTAAWLTDPDLENALGINGTLNATSIEFDFISISNQISFNYILASEEYFGNFPCEYSDGFALLIKRVDTNEPYQNIAVIPGTNIPVNTKTIHDEIVGFCDAENGEFFDGYNLGDTNFNGRTTVMTATADIVPNVQYHIKLVIADQNDKNYDSAVFIEGNSFSAVVDLGEDITSCAESYTLDADIGNNEATYSWFFNDSEIAEETGTSLDIISSGTYTVKVVLPFLEGTCEIEDTVEINLSATQTAEALTDYLLCDDSSNDGFETFDLESKTDEILESVPESNYDITYHYSFSDAENNTNGISEPIQNDSSPQLIHVRVRDITNGCLAFSTFNLIVNEKPEVNTLYDIFACDDDTANGRVEIDLSIYDDQFIGNRDDLIVTYYTDQNDAQNQENALEMPYNNTASSETLYVNISNVETGCSSVSTINYEIKQNPPISNERIYIDACDQDHDGFSTFNLNQSLNEILLGLNGVTVSFHETREDSELGQNPITNTSAYNNSTKEIQRIYVRVVDDQSSCVSTRSIELHTNLLLTGTNIRDFSVCDADNGDNTFNLNRIADIIANEIPDVGIIFFESESDRDNNSNALDNNAAYDPGTLPRILYIRLNSPTCTERSFIKLLLDPSYDFGGVETINFCDTDQDGFSTIDLSQFDSLLLNGETQFTVSYYETQENADEGINPLPNDYQNTSNPQTIYARISATETDCYDVLDFELNLLAAADVNTPTDIRICEPDGDGLLDINLENKISEIVTDPTDKEINFYLSYDDANDNLNAIAEPSNFTTGTQEIFVKVTDPDNICPSIVSFNIFVNTSPEIGSISLFEYCEMQSDGIGDFTFANKDLDILNDQEDKEVLYFTSQADAENNFGPLDKNAIYNNTSNPQTIFVRVQNVSDPACYNTASFSIAVGSSPEYNVPTDWFVCDDPSNDQREIFDLSQTLSEIKNGHDQNTEVTFHLSRNDAENDISPLDLEYTNVNNPQTIFVRIGNGNVCNVITDFELNVVQVPNANLPEPLVICDPDQDQTVSFNLEDSLINILDVRQDNIVISYFERMSDLENQTNAITNPQSYVNIANPQTVFVRLTNTVSNCFNAIPLELLVGSPPPINNIDDQAICDSFDHTFDLRAYDELIVDESAGLGVSYYRSQMDAEIGMNPLEMPYRYSTSSDKIYIRVVDEENGCASIGDFRLLVNKLPNATRPENLISCDDDYDGFLYFDLSQQDSKILGNQDPAIYNISYHIDLELAESGTDELDTNYEAIHGEVIYARVTNTATGCFSIIDFEIELNPLPKVEIPDMALCPERPTLMVSANTNIAGHSYLWSTGETTPEIEIREIGTYWVTVTTTKGCETNSVFNVVNSEPATIEVTETVDFSDPNNITVTISGIGNYLYQLDDNEPQESNIFERVPIGYHIVTIIDLNGCSSVSKEVLVIDTPKFMTPNGDGYWDHWHIIGVETLPGTVVQIFDRYGKKLAQLQYNEKGWDGNHNGRAMPATDYWYVADVIQGGFEFQIKGHFALRR